MREVDAYITNAPRDEDFSSIDVLYYNRHVNQDLIEKARAVGAKIVMDLDDHWELDPHHVAFQSSKKVRDLIIQQVQQADAVTCTHDRLAQEIYRYNKNVHVAANAIPNDPEYFPVKNIPAELTRLFWQGSITHEKDINLLRKTVRTLDSSRFMMVMAGYNSEDVEWFRMANAYTDYQKMPYSLLEGLPPSGYYRYYSLADVCLVPLLSTWFNGFKSNLKVLEAAHAGLPAIVSDVNPYRGLPVLYVRKESDWLKWINDKDAQRECARDLQAFCQEHYDYDMINQQRKEFLFHET